MLRVNQIKTNIEHSEEDLLKQISKALKIKSEDIKSYKIVKQSIDARKSEVKYTYTVDVEVKSEQNVLKRSKNNNISVVKEKPYVFPSSGDIEMKNPPVIVGSGPAGMFCALFLSRAGYRPVLIERGEMVEERTKTVDTFFETNKLDTESNVQFGEGGAGTFSDGKLNTLVKDVTGRNRAVLDEFVRHGAPSKITYVNKPHIGTDVLAKVVKNIRLEIIENGGKVLFNTKMTDVYTENGNITGIEVNDSEKIPCEVLVLALGHSARDTFEMLYDRKLYMEQKAFAMGVRIEHPQEMINESRYGEYSSMLEAADYKLTAKTPNGRGVYSFCMCPGGYVVNASSEEGRLAVNGMSYSKRDSRNANSAIVVTVDREDFKSDEPLAGMKLQRELEEKAYREGSGLIPVQTFKDFKNNTKSEALGDVKPCIKGGYNLANLRNVLPEPVSESIIFGIDYFDKIINNFNRDDAVLAGIESRTSSPVRISRDENFESNISGVYPCGEGAGYAGGITSAAMDGIKIAEAIASKYKK